MRETMSQKTPENYNLTQKQFDFVMAFCHGIPNCPDAKGVASKALSIAYDTSKYSKNALYVESAKMMNHHKINLAIQAEHRSSKKKHLLSATKVREKILSDLLSLSASTNENIQLKALEMLGKYVGVNAWASEKIETTQKIDVSTSREELETAIAQALGDSNVVQLFQKTKDTAE